MGAIEKIRAQQAQMQEWSAAWVVGEQLAEICAAEPESERLVDADLDAEGMGLKEAEAKIKAWADGHRQGEFAFVSPQKAEELLREFYGLPKRDVAAALAEKAAQVEQGGRKVNLLDFL